jgi:hypothetical protein
LPQHRGVPPPNKRLTPAIEGRILELYASGMSTPRILAALDGAFKTPKTILDVLKKHGVARRRPGRIDYALDSCWHEAFADVTTEAQAYWLGMLVTDGWVSRGATPGTWYVGLQLQERDRAHVEAFKAFLRSKNAVIRTRKIDRKTGREYVMYRLLVNSQQLRADLARYGVVERKSATAFLPTLPRPLMPHLLRGILDGDGCIAPVTGTPRRVIFYGTGRLVGAVATHLSRELGVTPKPPKPVLSIFGASWARQSDVAAILDYVYGSATVSLERKHTLYRRFLEARLPVSTPIRSSRLPTSARKTPTT